MNSCISVLGSTGSVGVQALEVAKDLKLEVAGIAANKNIDLLEKQIRIFKPKLAAIYDENLYPVIKKRISDTSTKILSGADGVSEVAATYPSEIVVSAISGISGLFPTVEAIKAKKNIALANKETLVSGGDLVTKLAKLKKVKLFPVDSEHSAIFQCLQGISNKKSLEKLILTASGGPFFGKSLKELENISPNQALKHPTWNMGEKISIDSATMMNKGLEVIEAAYLFETSVENIDVLIHPQSVIHSMVELKDGSVLAQMAVPSMKLPIQYALTYPNHKECKSEKLDLAKYNSLSFFKPASWGLRAINICKKAFKIGGNACTIINSANEYAVKLFLGGKVKFTDIFKIIEASLNSIEHGKLSDFEEIKKIDEQVKNYIENITDTL